MSSPPPNDSSHLTSCPALISFWSVWLNVAPNLNTASKLSAAPKLSAWRLSLGLSVFGSLVSVLAMPAVAQSSKDSGLLAVETHANLGASEENTGEKAVSPQSNLLRLSQFADQLEQNRIEPLPEGTLKQPAFSTKVEINANSEEATASSPADESTVKKETAIDGLATELADDEATMNKVAVAEAADKQATLDNDPRIIDSVNAISHEVALSAVPLDDELGDLRVRQLRSREEEELGILRLLQTAQAAPTRPKPPTAFLGARIGYLGSENPFRNHSGLSDQIYQSGLAFYLFPRLSNETSLYAIADTGLIRYETFQGINYNEVELQFGIRQRLFPRTYAQIGWRNQQLFSPGYRKKVFTVNAIDALISHRLLFNPRLWLDSFYQARLGFADPSTASRFRQTFTLSFNYSIARNLRTGLLYQLDFDDCTQISRYDTYQQVLGVISYNMTTESRLSLFGGSRFGRSSEPGINLSDTFYGAGLNVSIPLF